MRKIDKMPFSLRGWEAGFSSAFYEAEKSYIRSYQRAEHGNKRDHCISKSTPAIDVTRYWVTRSNFLTNFAWKSQLPPPGKHLNSRAVKMKTRLLVHALFRIKSIPSLVLGPQVLTFGNQERSDAMIRHQAESVSKVSLEPASIAPLVGSIRNTTALYSFIVGP